jgi:hypothetical protein
MLKTFAEYGVACTWATVGFLLADSRETLRQWQPARRPRYADARLDPYVEPVGNGEADDPLHYAPSLVREVLATPRQELATHTYSHYYCLEAGQDRETFAADLAAARAAAATYGVTLRSIVYPRNQRNPAYDDVLRDAGIVAYRGVQRGWHHAARPAAGSMPVHRALRFADAYAPAGPSYLFGWEDVQQSSGLCDVPASFFLRPYATRSAALEVARRHRLRRAIERAAAGGRLVHLWWHPHNFGVHLDENLATLRTLLDAFAACRQRDGMESLTMADVADRVRGAERPA